MPQVEYVSRPPTRPPQHVEGAGLPELVGSVESSGVEVALYAEIVAYMPPGKIQGYAPIDGNCSAAVVFHQVEESGSVSAEVDKRHPASTQPAQETPGVRLDVLGVVLGAERTNPAVEQL